MRNLTPKETLAIAQSFVKATAKADANAKDAAVARRRATKKAKWKALEAACEPRLLTVEECESLFAAWKAKNPAHRKGGEALAVEVVEQGAFSLVQAVRLGASKEDYTRKGVVRLVALTS